MLAVDPSSPFSGGALLGDRVRMQEHATDPGVFIRSMAARGQLGGLAAATPQAIRVLSGAGFDVVLVETVGVGQSEVEVAAAADTVVLVAGARAWVTGSRRPRPASSRSATSTWSTRPTATAPRQRPASCGTWSRLGRQLGTAEEARAGTGPSCGRWRSTGQASPSWSKPWTRTWPGPQAPVPSSLRRRRRAADEIAALALARLRAGAASLDQGGLLESLAERVRTGEIDPYRAADELLSVSGAATPAAP